MERKEWSFIDKSGWSEGAWHNEPDKIQWQDEATGLPCLIHRGPSGALCGYVGVSQAHPWFQIDYSAPLDPNTKEEDRWGAARPDSIIEVHGGLTFSRMCQGQDEKTGQGVCHVPADDEPDHVWWFGFDCAHSGDVCPAYDRYSFGFEQSYRDLAYVKREVQSLARQLHAVTA